MSDESPAIEDVYTFDKVLGEYVFYLFMEGIPWFNQFIV